MKWSSIIEEKMKVKDEGRKGELSKVLRGR
jgi:hypothetical protein